MVARVIMAVVLLGKGEGGSSGSMRGLARYSHAGVLIVDEQVGELEHLADPEARLLAEAER